MIAFSPRIGRPDDQAIQKTVALGANLSAHLPLPVNVWS
jgi:hypothetical protein